MSRHGVHVACHQYPALLIQQFEQHWVRQCRPIRLVDALYIQSREFPPQCRRNFHRDMDIE